MIGPIASALLALALQATQAPTAPGAAAAGPVAPRADTIATSRGPLVLTFLGHGTLMLRLGDTVVHVDPVGRYANYASLPKADLVLITHEHGDHLDTAAVRAVSKPGTRVLVSRSCAGRIAGAEVMENGQVRRAAGMRIEAVPAYNLVHVRAPGQPFHPRGDGNGYVLTVGGKRIYIAGDTENTPEMKALRNIDVAFLPMNLPYTMTPEMVADAARAFRPRLLYPYHYGQTDPQALVRLLQAERGIEVCVRDLR